jgi:nickel transport system substrate-binding protein
VAALAVPLAACGEADDAGARGTDGAVPPGGELRIAIAQSEPSLSVLDYRTNSFHILDQIYEPLVRYGPGGEIRPGLAERWETSPDGLTLTFHLRPGVTFSDGAPFDATVAKAGLERWIGNPDNSFLGVTLGTAGIEAPDATTLVLRLKQPYYPALQELTYVRPPRFVSPKALDASGAMTEPVGTGPYRLESSSETEIVLVRNDTYWGGRPNLDRVVFTVIPGSQARLAALQAGEVDIIGGNYLAPLAPEETLPLKGDRNVEIVSAPSATNLVLAFNTTGNPALADPKVRQAVNLAVDRAGYAKALFHGYAQPATRLFPASVPYAPEGSRDVPTDRARAAVLLEEAGWAGATGVRAKAGERLSLRLVLDPDRLPQAKALAEAVQADLAAVGIEVRIESLDGTAYSDAVSKRRYDLQFYATYGPPYDPFGMLNSNFRTREATSLYGTPELDRLIDAALATTDEQSRAAAYDAIWRLLDDAWAVAPLIETQRVWAVRTAVRGFELGTTEYDLPLTGVGVAR